MQFARAGRLFLQQAPLCDVLSAFQSGDDWSSMEGQDALVDALRLETAGVNASYRQRVLKAIVLLLSTTEVHESLLEAYLMSLSEKSTTAAGSLIEPVWSILTFELSTATPLQIRVSGTIGGGAETGCVLWPAGLALAAWVFSCRGSELCGKRVLELGAGELITCLPARTRTEK